MPSKIKSKSVFSKLNVFANSPRTVKLFGPFLIILMVAAVGYGGYVLVKNKFSSASTPATWFYNSTGIKHEAGRGYTDLTNAGDSQLAKAKGPAWVAFDYLDGANKYVWYGPGVNLKPGTGKQFIGCFYYMYVSVEKPGRAVLDVYDSTQKKVLNKYHAFYPSVESNQTLGGSEYDNLSRLGHNRGDFMRTCLAFYIPKSQPSNHISLRVYLQKGFIAIKATQISEVTPDNNQLSNAKILQSKPDNTSVITGLSYK